MNAAGNQGRDQGPLPKHEVIIACAISLVTAALIVAGFYVASL